MSSRKIVALLILVSPALGGLIWLWPHLTIFNREGLPRGVMQVMYQDEIVKSGYIFTLDNLAVHAPPKGFLHAGGRTLTKVRFAPPFFGRVTGAPYRWVVVRLDAAGHQLALYLIDEKSGELFRIKKDD